MDTQYYLQAGNVTMAFSDEAQQAEPLRSWQLSTQLILPQEDGNCLFERTSRLCLHCSQNGWCKTFIYLYHTNREEFCSYSSSIL